MACPFTALRKAQRNAYSKSFFLRVLEPLIVRISLWCFLMKRRAMSLSYPLCLTPERMRGASLALRAQMYLGCGKCGSLFRFHPRNHRAAICASPLKVFLIKQRRLVSVLSLSLNIDPFNFTVTLTYNSKFFHSKIWISSKVFSLTFLGVGLCVWFSVDWFPY